MTMTAIMDPRFPCLSRADKGPTSTKHLNTLCIMHHASSTTVTEFATSTVHSMLTQFTAIPISASQTGAGSSP